MPTRLTIEVVRHNEKDYRVIVNDDGKRLRLAFSSVCDLLSYLRSDLETFKVFEV